MPKIAPEMLAIGRPPRLEPAWRRAAANNANRLCCKILDAVLNERFPARIANPEEHACRLAELQNEFFEETAFLFDIAICRGLQEEPTQSVYSAFMRLLTSETVHNVRGGHESWSTWHAVHFGDFRIYELFDEDHAQAVNPNNTPAVTAMFYRAHELLRRIHTIAFQVENPISLDIMYAMPEEIRLSLQGTPSIETAKYQRPWLLVSEQYVVYRHLLADELGCSKKTLSNYEKDGLTSKGTPWPKPLNPDDTYNAKYYDPVEVLKALTALPKEFSKKTPIDTIIDNLMNNKLASKIVQKSSIIDRPDKSCASTNFVYTIIHVYDRSLFHLRSA